MREKLIELLKEAMVLSDGICRIVGNTQAVAIGHYLFANGVTIQKWIPVTERLPDERCFVLVFTIDNTVGEALFDGRGQFYWSNTDEDEEPLYVTHWMPLPEAPNGERRTDDRKTG